MSQAGVKIFLRLTERGEGGEQICSKQILGNGLCDEKKAEQIFADEQKRQKFGRFSAKHHKTAKDF